MNLIRLGTRYGGWVIPPGLLSDDSICYCTGAGEDLSFDVALIEQFGCHVYVFDPTPRAIAHVQMLREHVQAGIPMPINNNVNEVYQANSENLENKLHFFDVGLYGQDQKMRFYAPQDPQHVSHSVENLQGTDTYFEAQCRTVESIMRERGHDRLDLLKLDIEGAEQSVLDSIMRAKVLPRVLCAEFELVRHPQRYEDAALIFSELVRFGYDIVHAEQWNVTFVERSGRPSPKTIASLMKLAWARRKRASAGRQSCLSGKFDFAVDMPQGLV